MATLSDIAKKAGCSINLVSYVLKKKEPVTKEKHKKILQIAEELNYRTNHAARALVTGKSDNVTVIVNSFKLQMETAFFPEIISEIARSLEKKNMGMQLKELDSDEAIKNILLSGTTDGLIWYACEPSEAIGEMIAKENIPSISLLTNNSIMPSIVIDDYKSCYNMMSYLYDCGHRDFAYCGCHGFTTRERAYLDFLKDHNLTSRTKFTFEERAYNHIYVVKQVLNQSGVCFSAVMCERDSYAISLISLLKYFNISVPEKVSVVGYDDIPQARECDPALTTVHQPYTEMAEEAVYKLRRLIKGERLSDIPDHTVVHDVVRRNSVKILK